MTMNDFKNKVAGKWEQFLKSDRGQRIIKRTKSFIWRYGLFLVISGVAFFVDEILPELNLPAIVIAGIAYICNEITKDLNRKKDEIPN